MLGLFAPSFVSVKKCDYSVVQQMNLVQHPKEQLVVSLYTLENFTENYFYPFLLDKQGKDGLF
jgi:hypothetical protein